MRILLCLLMALILFSSPSRAESPQIGLFTGVTLAQNADFNNQNTKTNTHFTVGLTIPFKIGCHSSFCRGLFVEPKFSFSFPAKSNFGSTSIASTGITGTYSESQKIYSGNLVLKKYFEIKDKTTFFVSGGLGVSYFDLSNTNYEPTPLY